MYCLGIESTAHTFGCGIVDEKGKILADCRDVFRPPAGSGIHPRDASRHHAEVSSKVLHDALLNAELKAHEIDIVGYSAGPGLGPCLRVGAVVARTIAGFHSKPLVPVNHALGHIELGCLLTGVRDPLVLLVSGGHTMILVFSKLKWRVFGETLDITIGQLIDQFGRAIGYSSPCGPQIEKLAKGIKGASPEYLHLPYTVKGNDVSYSGILTAAKLLASEKSDNLSAIAYSLQETAFAMLAETIERAVSFTGKKEALVVGGVAANKRLADMLTQACEAHQCKLSVCPLEFAGDNGVQIAWTAVRDYAKTKNHIEVAKSTVRQSWRLDKVYVKWR